MSNARTDWLRPSVALIIALTWLIAGTAAAGPLSPAEEVQVLDGSNQFRADVANGLVGIQPQAANMTRLVWDANLAAVAQGWATQCRAQHNAARTFEYQALGGSANFVGENLYFTSVASGVPAAALASWGSEEAAFTFGPLQQADVATVGHYTQMVWANTHRVGCAQATCPTITGLPFGGEVFVCNYAPGGNFINQAPYAAGPPASACPATHPVVDGGLCGEAPPPPPPATIQLTTIQGISQWFFGMSVSNADKPVIKVELRSSGGTWFDLAQQPNDSWQTDGSAPTPLTLPLDVRLTAADNEVLEGLAVITDYSNPTQWDFGQQFTTEEPEAVAEEVPLGTLPAVLLGLLVAAAGAAGLGRRR